MQCLQIGTEGRKEEDLQHARPFCLRERERGEKKSEMIAGINFGGEDASN
jgi:hypothetical protein